MFIRNVISSDFDPIFELLRQLWTYKTLHKEKMKDMFNRNLLEEHIIYRCAVEEDTIIGFCSVTIKNNLWQQAFLGNIDELVVDETHRGKGTGSALIADIIKIAREKGCVQIELDSSFHREKAHQFYRNLGFESRAYLFTKELK